MVIKEKIIHIWVFLYLVYEYIGIFIILYVMKLLHSQASPVTYSRDTTFQCFCLFILPSLIQSSHYTSLKTLQTYRVQMQALKNQEECFFVHPKPRLNFFFFFFYFFFSSHKSFSSKSEVLCLIIDVRKNKQGMKLRTLI